MPSIPTETLEVGMQLDRDVLNPRGQVLIPEGISIEAKHLRGLQAWGIKTVSVTMSSAPESVIEEAGITLMSSDEVEQFTGQMFTLNKDIEGEELTQKLRTLTTDRLGQFGVSESVEDARESLLDEEPDASEKKSSLTVDELIKMANSIATLPNIYFELQNVMRRPTSASVDMAKAIRSDPGLTARLLRIVNSAYYSFPSKIETVPRAITIVGTDELVSLVTATSLLKAFGNESNGVFDMTMFWRHSIGAGVVARILGSKRHEQNVERFFVMGLLHDIGKVLMFSHIPKQAKAAYRKAVLEQQPLSQVESDDIGFSHSAVGAALARNWRMSAGQQEAITYHHRPSFAMRYRTEAAITHMADVLSHVLCAGHCAYNILPPIDIEAWQRLGLETESLTVIVDEADQKVAELIDIFFSE